MEEEHISITLFFLKQRKITVRDFFLPVSPSSLHCKKLKHLQLEIELLQGKFYVVPVLSLDRKELEIQCCNLYHRLE